MNESLSVKAMKLALEACEHLSRTGDTQVFDMCYADKVIPLLRAAIEDEAKYEKWVGLTLEEIDEAIAGNITITDPNLRDGVYGAIVDIELLLKDKNTHET